jgi:hypothetical protein
MNEFIYSIVSQFSSPRRLAFCLDYMTRDVNFALTRLLKKSSVPGSPMHICKTYCDADGEETEVVNAIYDFHIQSNVKENCKRAIHDLLNSGFIVFTVETDSQHTNTDVFRYKLCCRNMGNQNPLCQN